MMTARLVDVMQSAPRLGVSTKALVEHVLRLSKPRCGPSRIPFPPNFSPEAVPNASNNLRNGRGDMGDVTILFERAAESWAHFV